MKIYYIENMNYAYTDLESERISNLKTTNALYPIKIAKCAESGYLCKKKRIAKINRILLKLPYRSKVVLVNLLHIGRSYEEIYGVVERNHWIDFFYIHPASGDKSIPFCDSITISDNEAWCHLTTQSISMDKKLSKSYIRKLIISYGICKSKKKPKGRVRGSVNRQSDYDEHRDKILEGTEKGKSLATIVLSIGFGTKNGLAYYIKNRLN